MADITQIGGGGPVEIDGTLTTRGTGTHSGANTFSGTREHSGASTFSGVTVQSGAHCSSHAEVVANGSGYHHVTSSTGDDSGFVNLPSAQAAGQVAWIFNTDNADDVIVKTQGGATVATVGEGKVMLCISTGTGNNWEGIVLN
jgi:hypothetical protein